MTRRRKRIVGVVVLVWLAGSFSGAGLAWYIAERQTRDLRHDHNAIVCLFRGFVIPARARSVQTMTDRTQKPSAQARARNAVKTDDTVLRALITDPRSFDCSTFTP